MKAIVADVYAFYLVNSRRVKFPKKYNKHHIIWDMRQALLEIWKGELTELVIPQQGTPGYDFVDFIDKLHKTGQIKKKPQIKYYEPNIVEKS